MSGTNYIEVQFYLPCGPGVRRAYIKAELRLTKAVGGATITDAFGVWYQTGFPWGRYQEDVRTIVIVCEDTEENRTIMHSIAEQYKVEAKQELVMYTIKPVEAVYL